LIIIGECRSSGVRSQESGVRSQDKEGRRKKEGRKKEGRKKEGRINIVFSNDK
jgi:hypothetical protein